MAPLNRSAELQAAWRALAKSENGEGWRTIRILSCDSFEVRAGRHFPGNEETLLIGVHASRAPAKEHLPKGRGFSVGRAELGEAGIGRVWIALSRERAGSLDLFTLMADDVLGILEQSRFGDDDRLFHALISRIRAWQDFMQRGTDGVLSPESEVGLVGELVVLRMMLEKGLLPESVVDTWVGPLDGVQDFQIGNGALEIKATVAETGFIARIGSLEQLDESLTSPLFLGAVRLRVAPTGERLPDVIAGVRTALNLHPAALSAFDIRLLHAGYLDRVEERYVRRFAFANIRLIRVTDCFPRLTRSTVHPAISKARYELNLDLAGEMDGDLDAVLEELGAF